MRNGRIPSYNEDMRRKKNSLVPLEATILEAALDLNSEGSPEFYGYLMAKLIADTRRAGALIGYGTLYKALARLEERGLLTSAWEDPAAAADSKRPRRRLYSLTGVGADMAREVASRRVSRHYAFRPEPA